MKNLFTLAIAVLALTSCSNSLDFNQQEITVDTEKANKYNTAFRSAFGSVSTNVDWGFKSQIVQTLDENGNFITRSENVNRNEWGTGQGKGGYVEVPVNVTPDERMLVYNYFNQKREGATNQNNINWRFFFVSQVWKGNTVYQDGYGNDVVGSDHMNHLQCLKGEGSIDQWGNLQGDWEHINDFNNGD